jgi:hypothetical protein
MFSFTTKRVTTAAALVLLLGTTAYASSVHLKPPNSNPSFTDNGLTLRASASLSGLGGGDIVINMSATADATATCTNPGSGATQPPGQNPAPVTVSGSQTIPQDQIKNGNVSFSVTTVAPVSPISGAPGCPNSQWTEDITDLSFKTANITVDQPAGTLVLTVMCTFSPATSNGPVDSRTVTCTAS